MMMTETTPKFCWSKSLDFAYFSARACWFLRFPIPKVPWVSSATPCSQTLHCSFQHGKSPGGFKVSFEVWVLECVFFMRLWFFAQTAATPFWVSCHIYRNNEPRSCVLGYVQSLEWLLGTPAGLPTQSHVWPIVAPVEAHIGDQTYPYFSNLRRGAC